MGVADVTDGGGPTRSGKPFGGDRAAGSRAGPGQMQATPRAVQCWQRGRTPSHLVLRLRLREAGSAGGEGGVSRAGGPGARAAGAGVRAGEWVDEGRGAS